MNRFFILLISLLLLHSCSIQKEYYKEGKLKARGRIQNEVKTGKWKVFYPSGELFITGKYTDGKETGEWTIYHENGQLKQLGNYDKGKMNGEWKFFHSNGNPEGIGKLRNGQFIGRWQWYHTNGKLYTELLWDNGKLKTIVSCFDGYGNTLDKGSFSEGNGTRKLYDIHGNLLEIQNYKNGKYIK